MRKLDKKAKKGRKRDRAGRAGSGGHAGDVWLDLRGGRGGGAGGPAIWQDAQSGMQFMHTNVVFDAEQICFDVWLRTTSCTNWFMGELYEAHLHYSPNFEELECLRGVKGATDKWLDQMSKTFRETLYAFAGERALPELGDLYFESIMHGFGCRGRAGFAISAVYRKLAEILPEDKAAPFRNFDWEAEGRAIAARAMAEMDPALAEAYRKLREKLAGFAEEPDYELLSTTADNAQCRLPAGVPEGLDGRLSWLFKQTIAVESLIQDCLRKRQKWVNDVHGDLEDTVDSLMRPVGVLLDEMFRNSSPELDPFLLWFRTTLLDDCEAFVKDFVRRFEATGKSFAVFELYHVRLRFMQMVFEKAGRRKDLFWDMLEHIRQFLERRRVVREGSW